jgi:hypothetical protein
LFGAFSKTMTLYTNTVSKDGKDPGRGLFLIKMQALL